MDKLELGLEGIFPEMDIPLPMRRAGMARWHGDHIQMLDRRELPSRELYLRLETCEQVANAIENMAIQGAFSISIAAGYGLALSAPEGSGDSLEVVRNAANRLIATRPTGLAIKRMMKAALEAAETAKTQNISIRAAIISLVDQAARALARQGYEAGKNACDLLPDGVSILTHCFPDRAYVYLLLETARRGKQLNVVCSETRPYLQGARLTALCARQVGFPTSLITDGMGGFMMRQGKIDALITAADRVCMDGTVCNKIGTYPHALAADANNLPYYCLRQSGPDLESATEADIQVEYRNGAELGYWQGTPTAPADAEALYPSFDITPPELVTRIVTDRGVFHAADIASYTESPAVILDSIV